jgi:hypothetical protein
MNSQSFPKPALMSKYIVLVFDPGGVIGWAKFIVDAKAFARPENKILANVDEWSAGELCGNEHEQLTHAAKMIRDRRQNAHFDVVVEDFELTQMLGGRNLLSPVRINAVLEWECFKNGVAFNTQKRTMRTNVTRDRLRNFGFTRGFKKDEFAAMQHAIVWLRRLKQKSVMSDECVL